MMALPHISAPTTRRSYTLICDPFPRIRLVHQIKCVWKRPLSYHHSTLSKLPSKFKLDDAIWPKYLEASNYFHLQRPISPNLNKEAANLTWIVQQSANCSIPQSIPNPHSKRTVPRRNNHLQTLNESKNAYINILRRNISNTNIINHRRANARLKREIKLAQSNSPKNIHLRNLSKLFDFQNLE